MKESSGFRVNTENHYYSFRKRKVGRHSYTQKCLYQKLIASESVGVLCELSFWNFEVEGSLTST